MRKRKDSGFLILRRAGFLLALTFGVQKIGRRSFAFYLGNLSPRFLVESLAVAQFTCPGGHPLQLIQLFCCARERD